MDVENAEPQINKVQVHIFMNIPDCFYGSFSIQGSCTAFTLYVDMITIKIDKGNGFIY